MCQRRALAELDGLGDATLGEWHEWSGSAYHVRRRLRPDEQQTIGPAVDVRGTPEAQRRVAELGPRIRYVPPQILAAELGP
jgi:hypothetical protein